VLPRTLLAAALGIPLLVYAAVGAFSRYTADDFCWAGVLRTDGFVQSQVDWYTGFSPRYAFTFLVTVAESIGPAIVPLLPAAAIIAFLASLTWTFAQFGIVRTRAFILAEVAAFATLQTAPDLPQSLYWQTGMLTYLLPLILATFLIGWIRRGNHDWWAVGLCGVVTFIAGGLSEAYLIPQNVGVTLALVASIALRTSRTPHLAAALAGGVLALAIVLAAPATGSRVGGPPADLWLALSASIATAAFQVRQLVRPFTLTPLTVLLCLATPALLAAWPCRVERRWLALVTACVVITLPFCYFPSFYAQNGNPPARSLIVPGAILIGYLVFLGTAIPLKLGEPRRRLALAALALVPVGIAIMTLPDVEAARSYAVLFDAEERQIRAIRDAGQMDITVPPLPANLGENFVTADRKNWFNVCVARYYDVRSIATPSS
jgi:hypothetical protein